MPNDYFRFKKFMIKQDRCAMKVGTDGVLLGAWADIHMAKNILDIGTGSGLIALMIAQRNKLCSIDAIEIEEQAYIQAQENFSLSSWTSRIKAIHIDFQAYTKSVEKKYDHIVSNPPFFTKSLKTQHLEVNLARHNDQLPFDQLIDGVNKLLDNNGKFSVVLPYVEGCIFIVEAAKKSLFCVRRTLVKSKPKAPVSRMLMEFKKIPAFCYEDNLLIHSGFDNDYSEKYVELTMDFYLNF